MSPIALIQFLILPLAFINLLVFLLYAYDKFAAQHLTVRERIPENTLIYAALLLAFPGAQLARWLFHHKTRDEAFKRKYYKYLLIEAIIIVLLLLIAAAIFLNQ